MIRLDGSDVFSSAPRAKIEFARQIKAEAVGISVTAQYQYPIYGDVVPSGFPTEEEGRETMRTAGELHLAAMRDGPIPTTASFQRLPYFLMRSFRRKLH